MTTPSEQPEQVLAMRKLYRRARWEVRELLGRYSRGLPILAKDAKWAPNLVRPDSAICIEGYPRSGNTFSVAAFQMMQEEPLHVARHTHLAGQVLRGLEFGVPVVILIRPPAEAVGSLLVRSPHLSAMQAVRSYERFYSRLLPRRNECVVSEFAEVIGNFGNAIRRVNEKFGTDFGLFDGSPEQVERCFMIVEEMDRADCGSDNVTETHVGRPSEERDRLKKVAMARLESGAVRARLGKAEDLYRTFVAD